ncbi:hypothetical protein ACJQWK_07171 [Exserohilum turcicum]
MVDGAPVSSGGATDDNNSDGDGDTDTTTLLPRPTLSLSTTNDGCDAPHELTSTIPVTLPADDAITGTTGIVCVSVSVIVVVVVRHGDDAPCTCCILDSDTGIGIMAEDEGAG